VTLETRAELGFIISTFGVAELYSYKEKAPKKDKEKRKRKGKEDDLELTTFECANTSVTGDIKITLIERTASLVGRTEEVGNVLWWWLMRASRTDGLLRLLTTLPLAGMPLDTTLLVLVQYRVHRQFVLGCAAVRNRQSQQRQE
jgi:hypothetical protein